MHWEHRRELASVPAEDVLDRFRERPISWLLPFLQLAATQAEPDRRGPDAPQPPWYRLSVPDADGSSRFLWHPHGHLRLFRGLSGQLAVSDHRGSSALDLRCTTTGGEADVNAVAIDAFIDLLAAAIEGSQSVG